MSDRASDGQKVLWFFIALAFLWAEIHQIHREDAASEKVHQEIMTMTHKERP